MKCLVLLGVSMRKKIWINVDDIVLVAGREFGNISDIIHKYSIDDQSGFLYDNNCIPKKENKSKDNVEFIDNGEFDFQEKEQNKYVNYNEIIGNMYSSEDDSDNDTHNDTQHIAIM